MKMCREILPFFPSFEPRAADIFSPAPFPLSKHLVDNSLLKHIRIQGFCVHMANYRIASHTETQNPGFFVHSWEFQDGSHRALNQVPVPSEDQTLCHGVITCSQSQPCKLDMKVLNRGNVVPEFQSGFLFGEVIGTREELRYPDCCTQWEMSDVRTSYSQESLTEKTGGQCDGRGLYGKRVSLWSHSWEEGELGKQRENEIGESLLLPLLFPSRLWEIWDKGRLGESLLGIKDKLPF